jgi:hypothetical protein
VTGAIAGALPICDGVGPVDPAWRLSLG